MIILLALYPNSSADFDRNILLSTTKTGNRFQSDTVNMRPKKLLLKYSLGGRVLVKTTSDDLWGTA